MSSAGRGKRTRSRAALSHTSLSKLKPRTQAIERELQSIRDGSHALYRERVRVARDQRAHAIAVAEKWRQERIANIEAEFDGCIKQARDTFEEDKRLCKEKLMDELKRKKRRVIDTSGVENASMSRKGNRTSSYERAHILSSRRCRGRRDLAFEPDTFCYELSSDEVQQDLETMKKPYEPSIKDSALKNSPERSIRFENGVLYCNEHRFEVGQFVQCCQKCPEGVLPAERDFNPFIGQILILSPSEILLQDRSGSERVIFLAELRAQRFTIQLCESLPTNGQEIHRSLSPSPSNASRS